MDDYHFNYLLTKEKKKKEKREKNKPWFDVNLKSFHV